MNDDDNADEDYLKVEVEGPDVDDDDDDDDVVVVAVDDDCWFRHSFHMMYHDWEPPGAALYVRT